MRHRQVVLETASAVVVGRQSSQVARQMLHSSGVRSPQGRRMGGATGLQQAVGQSWARQQAGFQRSPGGPRW